MVVPQNEIEVFIPHRHPFVMIDNLLTVQSDMFESDFYISEDNILIENGQFQEGGLIENIAQTCAASFGFLDKDKNDKPKIGYIGAISKVLIHELPPVNSKIATIVQPTHQLGNIFMVQGRNYFEGRLLLECEMKIVVTE